MTEHPTGPLRDDDPTASIVNRPWSGWILFLDKRGLFPETEPSTRGIPYEVSRTALPAVYEIARQRSRKEAVEILYVGKTTRRTGGIRTRLRDHYTLEDALYDRLVEALIRRYALVVRFVQFGPDEETEADRVEQELRRRLPASRYPWNAPA